MAVNPVKEYTPGYSRRSQSLFVLPGKKTRAKVDSPNHKLVKFGELLFDQAKGYRDGDLGMKERWQSYRSWYLGSGARNSSLTYSNMIFETVEKLAADLTDGRPTFQFEPNRSDDIPMADFLGKAVPWVWDQHDLQAHYYDTVKGSLVFGNWYWKVVHDPRFANQGATIPAFTMRWQVTPTGTGRSSLSRSRSPG